MVRENQIGEAEVAVAMPPTTDGGQKLPVHYPPVDRAGVEKSAAGFPEVLKR
jgi:hypothetical protein